MKIESNPKAIGTANHDLNSKKNELNRTDKPFGQVLSETVESRTPSLKTTTGPMPMSGVAHLQFDPMRNGVDRPLLVSKLDQMLDLLDQYRMNLEDPRVTLRDMAPLTHEMESRLNELMPALDKLDQQDPLTPILNETLITATLEVRKFDNGWYIP